MIPPLAFVAQNYKLRSF